MEKEMSAKKFSAEEAHGMSLKAPEQLLNGFWNDTVFLTIIPKLEDKL